MGRPCTERQANFLAEHGFNPDNFDFDAASQQIDQIKNPNGGQRQGGGYQQQQRGNGGDGYRQTNNQPRNGNGRQYSRPSGQGYRNDNGGQRNGYRGNGGSRNASPRNNNNVGPRDPNAPASPRQREILVEYGYDPNITISQASDIIGALKDNNWEPLPDDQPSYSGQGNQGGGYNAGGPNELPWQ
jgi:hypothetical protein